ncbi:hypothetical protein DF186_16790, partial [Enterococcus hirae]
DPLDHDHHILLNLHTNQLQPNKKHHIDILTNEKHHANHATATLHHVKHTHQHTHYIKNLDQNLNQEKRKLWQLQNRNTTSHQRQENLHA